MALTLELKKTGYRAVKFAGSSAVVFVCAYKVGVGFVGVRNEVAVKESLRTAATADRDAVARRIAAASDLFEPFSWPHPQPPSWSRWFTPGKSPEAFFSNYTWFRYKEAGRAHDFLGSLVPNP